MSKLNQEELLKWLSLTRDCLSASGLWDWHGPSKDTQAYQQIKEMIQKPGVTEEWIEEKANWLFKKSWVPISIDRAKDFIRSFIKDLADKIEFNGGKK